MTNSTPTTPTNIPAVVVSPFIDECGNPMDQDVSSLKAHFSSISAKCSYFSANYAKVLGDPKSGENDDDKWQKLWVEACVGAVQERAQMETTSPHGQQRGISGERSLEMMRIQQDIDRKRIEISKMTAYAEKITSMASIMTVDPETLSGPRKYFFETMQKRIAAEMMDEEMKQKEQEKQKQTEEDEREEEEEEKQHQ
ncbi:hypothetical protein BDA99DRAFT_602701 [Phascolomyces articulosus]|uniref:No apical meristem-associated C-terminal domain-containing protein n=1 Tax=Phascolomyces articulosus TaxID=60185 RepID=A0AAD5PI60_9FUNG|nr:hypothetical protein BDA99DRAFT_602701 [Phascolomyces articulosus]